MAHDVNLEVQQSKGANTPKYKHGDWKERLGVRTVKHLGPRGSKHKILKIKSN